MVRVYSRTKEHSNLRGTHESLGIEWFWKDPDSDGIASLTRVSMIRFVQLVSTPSAKAAWLRTGLLR
jgi:hypothetical protein